MNEWQGWLASVWADLSRHGHLVVPPYLPPPAYAGFSQPWLSERVGQTGDWTLSLSDGSRVHLHEYPDGTLVAHRDSWDPAQGIGQALSHFVFETSLGRLSMLVAVAVGFGALANALGFGLRFGSAKTALSAMVPIQ